MLELAELIDIAETHTSPDVARPNLNYARVEAERVWATDGHRALILKAKATPEQTGAYLEGRLFPDAPAGPSIDQVWPKGDQPIAVVLGKDCMNNLRTIARVTNQWTQTLVYFYEDKKAHVSFGRSSKGDHEVVNLVLPEAPVTRKHTVGFNLRYLLEALDAVGVYTDDVTLYQADAGDPILIKGIHGTALVMPCR